MPARKDFVKWFTKKFPHSCIDSDHARSCLAGWNAMEEKLTAHNTGSPKLFATCTECSLRWICSHDVAMKSPTCIDARKQLRAGA